MNTGLAQTFCAIALAISTHTAFLPAILLGWALGLENLVVSAAAEWRAMWYSSISYYGFEKSYRCWSGMASMCLTCCDGLDERYFGMLYRKTHSCRPHEIINTKILRGMLSIQSMSRRMYTPIASRQHWK